MSPYLRVHFIPIYWIELVNIQWVCDGKIERIKTAAIVQLKFKGSFWAKTRSELLMISTVSTLDGALASSHTCNITPHLHDAGRSWHIPDNLTDSASNLWVLREEQHMIDTLTDRQTSQPAVLATPPSAASCLIGWWALWLGCRLDC